MNTPLSSKNYQKSGQTVLEYLVVLFLVFSVALFLFMQLKSPIQNEYDKIDQELARGLLKSQ